MQAKAHEEAMNQLIKAGYIKTCTEGLLHSTAVLCTHLDLLHTDASLSLSIWAAMLASYSGVLANKCVLLPISTCSAACI